MANIGLNKNIDTVIDTLNNKADIGLENSDKASEIESIANSAASAAESANTVATAASTLIHTTVDEIDKDLNDTKSWVTTELANFKTNNTSKSYVIETYSDGANWYRIYSDGWKEQGGLSNTNSSFAEKQNAKISFIKSFSNTNYTLISIPKMGTDGARVGSVNYVTKNTSNCTCYLFWTNSNGHGFDTNYPFNWYACGY